MDADGYVKAGEIRVSLLWVNIIGICIAIPVTLAFGLSEMLLHGIPSPTGWDLLFFVVAFVAQLALHEWLHAVGYTVFGGLNWKQVKFGVNWAALAVYCNCLAPVSLRPFRLACLLPILVLFPLSLAAWIISKEWWLSFYCAVVLMGGIGDVIMFIKTLSYPSDLFIVEHASGIGGDLFSAPAGTRNPAVTKL